MQLDDGDVALFKKWLIKKLEDVSDADSEVLADYVLALIRNDESTATAKASCIENLKDFLPDNVEPFVNDVFRAIETKAYDPSSAKAHLLKANKRSAQGFHESNGGHKAARKRSFRDWDQDVAQQNEMLSYEEDVRPAKHTKRSGKGQGSQRSYTAGQQDGQHAATLPPIPFPIPDMTGFDPAAAMMAMQQFMGLIGLGEPPAPPKDTGQRCRDYDTMGFCTRGASCPYDHGETPYMVPLPGTEYESGMSMLHKLPKRPEHTKSSRGNVKSMRRAGRAGRGRSHRGGRSQREADHDTSNASIVIEQIPPDDCSEDSVRDFFGQFGIVAHVEIHPADFSAIVKFDTFEAAKAAYDSPKAIFDNRFVKVSWIRSATDAADLNGRVGNGSLTWRASVADQEPEFDYEEVVRRQEEAQRKFEELQKAREEARLQRAQLDEQIQAKEAERAEAMAILAQKTGQQTGDAPEESEQTKALKAQLAQLQAEARSLGIDTDAAPNGHHVYPGQRGRGGFRGRGRGRGYFAGHRGSWFGTSTRGAAVMRLDNRPKTVCVSFEDGEYADHEEALRQFLMLNSMDSAQLSKYPDRDDAALVAFAERYEGENFMAAAAQSELPHVGKVEHSWYPSSASKTISAAVPAGGDDDSKTSMDVEKAVDIKQSKSRTLRDMDTFDEADDDDDYSV